MPRTQDETKYRQKPVSDDASRAQVATVRERDDAAARPRAREGRIGAAQMAAPSTRRWRRAGRFEQSA
jgi:hypothetical protein